MKLKLPDFVIDILDSTHWQWRSGRLGKMMNRHSPTAHVMGMGCWCGLKELNAGQSFAWGMFQVDMEVNRREAMFNGRIKDRSDESRR